MTEDCMKTDSFLVRHLGDDIASGIDHLFEETGVVYDKEQYIQFQETLAWRRKRN
jgi:hypothetical protein